MPAAAPISEDSRVVHVTVLDQHGRPASGAKVAFLENGVPYGSAEIGNKGATITLPRSVGAVEVQVEFMRQRQTANIPSGQLTLELKFGTSSLLKAFSPPVARCPDGSSGQPCVDCVIAGKPIRICT